MTSGRTEAGQAVLQRCRGVVGHGVAPLLFSSSAPPRQHCDRQRDNIIFLVVGKRSVRLFIQKPSRDGTNKKNKTLSILKEFRYSTPRGKSLFVILLRKMQIIKNCFFSFHLKLSTRPSNIIITSPQPIAHTTTIPLQRINSTIPRRSTPSHTSTSQPKQSIVAAAVRRRRLAAQWGVFD